MPVLETVTLSDLLDHAKQELELVAWTQGQDDAFGCDRFVMLASILRQIYQRMRQGRHCTDSEMKVARDMQRCQDTDRDTVPTIARMALLVAPQEGESDEAKAASIADFAKQHQLYLEALVDGHLTVSAAGEAAKLTEGNSGSYSCDTVGVPRRDLASTSPPRWTKEEARCTGG